MLELLEHRCGAYGRAIFLSYITDYPGDFTVTPGTQEDAEDALLRLTYLTHKFIWAITTLSWNLTNSVDFLFSGDEDLIRVRMSEAIDTLMHEQHSVATELKIETLFLADQTVPRHITKSRIMFGLDRMREAQTDPHGDTQRDYAHVLLEVPDRK